MQPVEIPPRFGDLVAQAREGQAALLTQRQRRSVDLPLSLWRQQAHFTTPASGSPDKAIRGLAGAQKTLGKFGISLPELAAETGASQGLLEELLGGEPWSPFVMVDVEDSVAAQSEAIAKAREGAVRVFTESDWGPTLPFFRPSGLAFGHCLEDLVTVLGRIGERQGGKKFPVAGIVWPKAEHPEELAWVSRVLSGIEERLGLAQNQIKLEFLVESGWALKQVGEMALACVDRLAGIIWGIADYSADTNLPQIRNDHPVADWARCEIVNVAGAVGVPAIDAMTLNYPTPLHRGENLNPQQQAENKRKVLAALKEVYDDARHGIELGMTGKWVGHPAQLLMVLAAYRGALAPAQIQKDLQEVEAYQAAVKAGAGATMLGEGQSQYMADRATDRHVRARLRRATAWGLLNPDQAVDLGLVSPQEAQQLREGRA